MNYLKMDWDLTSIYYTSVSFLGILFLILMIIWIPPSKTIPNYQKPLIYSVFFIICFSGMIAALYPSTCSQFFLTGTDKDKNKNLMKFEGHHPVCGEFNSHTFSLRGKKYCAGCTGLIIGTVLAMVGTVIYYLYGDLGVEKGLLLLSVGLGAVFFSLLQIIFLKMQNNLVKLFSNMILVIGSLLILIGINATTNNLFTELYFLMLIVFWILARIKVSSWDHDVICRNCKHICPLDKELTI